MRSRIVESCKFGHVFSTVQVSDYLIRRLATDLAVSFAAESAPSDQLSMLGNRKCEAGAETLEQAFLALTGSTIRAEDATSMDQMRNMAKMFRGRGRG